MLLRNTLCCVFLAALSISCALQVPLDLDETEKSSQIEEDLELKFLRQRKHFLVLGNGDNSTSKKYVKHQKTSLNKLLSHGNGEGEEELDSLKEIPIGVTGSRSIAYLTPGSNFIMDVDGNHCTSRDEYGDNECHFDWSSTVKGNFTVFFSQEVDEGAYAVVKVRLDRLIPWQFSCNICGEPCIIRAPFFNFSYSFETPECPMKVGTYQQYLEFQLWDKPPVDVLTRLDGHIEFISAAGETLAEGSGLCYLK